MELSPEEIVAHLANMGVEINKRTLFNYTANGCLPEPIRGAGYGGRWVRYSEFDIMWALVTWRLVHGKLPNEANNVTTTIKGVKPPFIPPKTVGILHREYVAKLGIFIEDNAVEDIEKIERGLADLCWKNLSGTDAILLRSLQGWYIHAVNGAIKDIASYKAKTQASKQTDIDFLARFMVEYREYWDSFLDSFKN